MIAGRTSCHVSFGVCACRVSVAGGGTIKTHGKVFGRSAVSSSRNILDQQHLLLRLET